MTKRSCLSMDLDEKCNIFVFRYDIGGGTLDCSMLFMNGDGGKTVNRKGQTKTRGYVYFYTQNTLYWLTPHQFL